MPKAKNYKYPYITIKESPAPTDPEAGDQRVFIDEADHLPKRKESDGTITEFGSGSGGGGGVTWPGLESHPDRPPTTPNAMDDEFDGVSLDAKWTVYNPASITAPTTAFGSSWFTTIFPVVQVRGYGYTQPAPAGNWRVRAKLAFDGVTGPYFSIGLGARRAVSGKAYVGGAMFHTTQPMLAIIVRYTEPNTYNSEFDGYQTKTMVFYLEMEYDGTNLIWRYSTTGSYYSEFYREAVATHLGGAASDIGILAHPWNNSSSSDDHMVMSVDWFRRVA